MLSRSSRVFRFRLYWHPPKAAYPKHRTWPMIALPELLSMVGFCAVPVNVTPYSDKPTNAVCCPQGDEREARHRKLREELFRGAMLLLRSIWRQSGRYRGPV
jgi:hypothetical protein